MKAEPAGVARMERNFLGEVRIAAGLLDVVRLSRSPKKHRRARKSERSAG